MIATTLQAMHYATRPARGSSSWTEATDPDGNVRDRMQERTTYLLDRREEIDFVQKHHGGGLVVDFGCGPGWMLSALSDCQKLGIEIDQQAARAAIADGLDVTGSLGGLPDDFADVMIAYHVIEHLEAPINAMREIRRIVKPGGWLVLGTPDFESPCAKRFGPNYRMLHDPTHISLFSLESVYRLLRENDWTIYDQTFPFPERYATAETMLRWNDTSQVSPPWPGNWVTFYARNHQG